MNSYKKTVLLALFMVASLSPDLRGSDQVGDKEGMKKVSGKGANLLPCSRPDALRDTELPRLTFPIPDIESELIHSSETVEPTEEKELCRQIKQDQTGDILAELLL